MNLKKSGDNNLNHLSVNDSLWQIYNNKSKPDTVRLKAIHQIVWSYMGLNPDTSFILASEELLMAQATKQRLFEGKAIVAMGAAVQSKGDFENAIEYYLKAQKIFEKVKFIKGIGSCYNNIGLAYQNLANYSESLKYYLNSVKIYNVLGDKLGLGQSLTNIGTIYLFQQEYDKALNYYMEGAKINEEIDNKSVAALCYNNIGIVYKYKLNYSKAAEYYFKGLKIREEIGDKGGIAGSYINIGGNFQDENNLEQALDYFMKALMLSEELGRKSEMCVCFINLAGLYNKLSNFKKAIQYCDSGLKIAEEIGDINNERLAYQFFSQSYLKMNNYKEAYNYHVLFKQLTDSIFNANNSKQLGDIKTQYEVDKKEAELKIKSEAEKKVAAAQLKQEKAIKYFLLGGLLLVIVSSINFYYQRNKQKKLSVKLQLSNAELKKINDSKTKLFSIIGHDIKSPMASIQGYTELISDNDMSFTEEEIKEFAKTMNLSVKNLNAMLDNILLWSLNESQQLKPQFNVLSINDVINSTIELLAVNARKKNINVIYKSNIVGNIENDKNILSTVIRNILSNAIKFSKQNSEININSVTENNLVVISISDWGIGMSQTQIDNVLKYQTRESTIGTDNEKGTGLGLFLCYEFMQKINGQFLIESNTGKGTTVTLKLKPSNFS